MSGEVYFIEGGGRIKIGYSIDVDDRLKALSTGSSYPLKIIGRMPGTYGLEKAIHKKLVEYRVQGEWFEDCSWTREVISALLSEGAEAVGYHFVPSKKARCKPERNPADSESTLRFGKNPFEEATNRISAACEPYATERVASARRRENQLGLVPGILVNPIIGGFYTPDRMTIAAKMIFETWDQVADVNRVMYDAIIEDEGIPDGVYNDLLTGFARTLKNGLRALFSNPDLEVIDLGPFVWLERPDGDLSRAQLRSTNYKFAYGRKLQAEAVRAEP